MPVGQYLAKRGELGDVEVRATIVRAVDVNIDGQWQAFVAANRAKDLDQIITEENLRPEQTREFVRRAFRDGAIPTAGTAITAILPPVSRFARTNNHSVKKQTVLDKLTAFFSRYFGLARLHLSNRARRCWSPSIFTHGCSRFGG